MLDRALSPLVRRRSARKLQQVRPPIRLHLGCGMHFKPGWVNLDLWPPRQTPVRPGVTIVSWDLSRALPLQDGSVEEIYSSHFLEHLDGTVGAWLLNECRRLLRPGGRLRTSVPDFERVARAYVAGDEAFFAPLYDVMGDTIGDGVPGGQTMMDPVNNVLYQSGEHHCMYDAAKLQRLLSALGFSRVEQSPFDPAIDGTWDAREHFSVCVDAWK